MSDIRKGFKVLCFCTLIAGVALIYPTVIAVLFGGGAPVGMAQAALYLLCVLGDVALGMQGIGAANVPSRAIKLLPIIVAALLINIAAVGFTVFIGGMVAPLGANALLVFAYAILAHLVNGEYLRTR